LGRRIGLVLQNPDHQLFALTAADEVAFGLKNCGFSGAELDRLVDEALDAAGLREERDSYPYNMSLADRRKLSVAAVAAPGPEVLIFDEPSTGQDPSGRRALAGLAAKLNQAETTVLMISHDMELISEYTSRLIVMGAGKILADGPTREIFQMTDLLASTYSAPPQITRLAQSLRPYGLTKHILTASELSDSIENVREPAV
jgi:energy-coupling factor transport system ATP-binding protein